jgi:hypothetical protein
MKYLSILLFIFIAIKAESKSSLYSGGTSIYSESLSRLALHSHGVKYNAKTSKLNSFSFIKFIAKDSFDSAITLENTPKLIALAWSDDEKYLVGITNIKDNFLPHFIVYDYKGSIISTKTLDCESHTNKDYSWFCANNPEQHWSNRQINSLRVTDLISGLDVCIGKLCVALDFPKNKAITD